MEVDNMPEKMTKREAEISRAIRLVRKAKETMKLVGSSTELPYDSDGEEVKVKRPKAEKYDEDKNQKKEDYGMGGEETIGKSQKDRTMLGDIKGPIGNYLRMISYIFEDMSKELLKVVGSPFLEDEERESRAEEILGETLLRYKKLQDQMQDEYEQ
jgi:hypothetical protein|tara:strand:+ start:817 stop:1284 length:468 start_codon:yes stop_codon:yes gene_type:complete